MNKNIFDNPFDINKSPLFVNAHGKKQKKIKKELVDIPEITEKSDDNFPEYLKGIDKLNYLQQPTNYFNQQGQFSNPYLNQQSLLTQNSPLYNTSLYNSHPINMPTSFNDANLPLVFKSVYSEIPEFMRK